MLQDIVEKQIEIKHEMSSEAKNLLHSLLQRNPAKRLGTSKDDAEEIKTHPWFSSIEWDRLIKKDLSPPY